MNRHLAVAAAGWLATLALVPLGRDIVDALRTRHLLLVFVTALLVATFMLVVAWASLSARRDGSFARPLVVLGVVAAGLVATVLLLPRIEERVHTIMFGGLGALVYRASGERLVLAGLVVCGLGWLDEGAQALLPSRVYDLSDVTLNAVAGIAGVALARVGSTQRSLGGVS